MGTSNTYKHQKNGLKKQYHHLESVRQNTYKDEKNLKKKVIADMKAHVKQL
jgi:hypothetical protein